MPSLSLAYLKAHIDEAIDLTEAEEVLITRDNGANLILVKETDWRALQEALHLLSTPLNAERLQQSLQQAHPDLLTELP